jgi:indole-3-glycerol phosphate synthase
MSGASSQDLLAAIVAATRKSVDTRRARESQAALESRAASHEPRGAAFRDALATTDRVNVIAECKRRSPSRGVLRRDYDPVAIARAYEQAGAAALSVLTEPAFFDGALEHLEAVRGAVQLPLLRKDFIVEEYQLFEAIAAGADAVLLIVAALSESELVRLQRRAHALGLATVVEVHDAEELDRALAAQATIIGVNNRNLRTLEVDVHASEALARRMPKDVVTVSESGLKSAEELQRMRALGYNAFLIGERLMTAADPGAVLSEMLRGFSIGNVRSADLLDRRSLGEGG